MESLFARAGIAMDGTGDPAPAPAVVLEPAPADPPPAVLADPPPAVPKQQPAPADEPPVFFDAASLSPELQGQWKRMQAAFTKGRQKDRETVRSYAEKASLVDRFYSDPAFALETIRQVAPQLGIDVPAPPRTQAPTPGTSTSSGPSLQSLLPMLQEKLGPDLQFLAPALAQAVLDASHDASTRAVAPLQARLDTHDRLQGQAVAEARRAEQQRLAAELDGKLPGWDAQYGERMRDLDAFLNSTALSHPEFGSKYELYLRILNPGLARADAVRDIGRAAGNRVATGHPSGATAPGAVEKIRDVHARQGWNAAWKYAIDNIDTISEELNR